MNTKCFLKLDTTVGIRNLWTFSDVNQGFWPASRHLRYKQTLRSACFGAQTSPTSTHKPHKSQDLQSPEELLEGLAQVVTIGKLQVSHPWILLYILYIYTVRHVYILEPQSEPPNCTMHSMYIHIHTYHIYIDIRMIHMAVKFMKVNTIRIHLESCYLANTQSCWKKVLEVVVVGGVVQVVHQTLDLVLPGRFGDVIRGWANWKKPWLRIANQRLSAWNLLAMNICLCGILMTKFI